MAESEGKVSKHEGLARTVESTGCKEMKKLMERMEKSGMNIRDLSTEALELGASVVRSGKAFGAKQRLVKEQKSKPYRLFPETFFFLNTS